jgi:hypothetical protein
MMINSITDYAPARLKSRPKGSAGRAFRRGLRRLGRLLIAYLRVGYLQLKIYHCNQRGEL